MANKNKVNISTLDEWVKEIKEKRNDIEEMSTQEIPKKKLFLFYFSATMR